MGTVVSLRGADAPTALAVRDVFVAYEAGTACTTRTPRSADRRRDAPARGRTAGRPRHYALALDWRERTHGAFTPHRPDGVLDLSGVVKALAIRDAGAVSTPSPGRGPPTGCSPSAGDVLASGTQGDDPWQVGVVDPLDRTRVVGVVRSATTVGRSRPPAPRARRTRLAPGRAGVPAGHRRRRRYIVTADVLATAVLAGDEHDLASVTEDGSVDVLAFGVDGRVWATPGASAYVSAAAADRRRLPERLPRQAGTCQHGAHRTTT